MKDCYFFWMSVCLLLSLVYVLGDGLLFFLFCFPWVYVLGDGLLFFLFCFWVALSCQYSSPGLFVVGNDCDNKIKEEEIQSKIPLQFSQSVYRENIKVRTSDRLQLVEAMSSQS